MKATRMIVTIFISVCFTFTIAACTNKKALKADTPANTGWLMKMAMDSENYDNFNKLFSEGRKNSISKEEFSKLKKLTTAGTDFKHYELLTFTNGEMFLVRLTPEKVNGEYKIEDVIIVPEEMKKLFNDNK